ncbi:heteromeric transposase endonuclease subunit TnsA [Thiohalorhabdus methylotrophus]|uniref:Heteromeric transposase endonuclease subunit TnsA n=1 Tax=Thiohalorhabdus methylotrophus TaxID=3242694 RepID=A0ABV4TQH7_9GAMM
MRNYRSVTGISLNRGEGRVSAYESTLERDLMTALEFDLGFGVETYEEQPVVIEYTKPDGARGRYTPDILIKYRAAGGGARQPGKLVEVKYSDELKEKWAELEPRFAAARAYAEAQGWTFEVLTELEIRTPYFKNVKFLLPYRQMECDDALMEAVAEALAGLGQSTPKALVASVSPHWRVQGEAVAALWCLAARRAIALDLSVPVTMKSPIELAEGWRERLDWEEDLG